MGAIFLLARTTGLDLHLRLWRKLLFGGPALAGNSPPDCCI